MMSSAGIKIKRFFAVIVLAVVCFALAAVLCAAPVSHAETVVEGDDDVFELIETECGADDRFVFSATANFESGQAAGLVFGASDDKYWVFNVDRANNAVKLMHFDLSSGSKVVTVLREENYVGSALLNDGEQRYVKSRTAAIDKVYLKVAVTPTEDGVLAQLYADGIRRFAYKNGSEDAVDLDISSVTVGEGDDAVTVSYAGGKLGYNCFNAKVRFTDDVIGETDFANYTELYRNQYHFSQFAHWNNDPNGLVYYNGYYHLYFQHNPYGNTWDDMHWGHARSRDLVHWELLPIALVPDYDLPEGDVDKLLGAMWSGSARVYHVGDSDKIDNEYKWFDETGKNVGDAVGLIGFYSWWNGAGGNRYTIVMYSTDGGLSWNKRNNIPISTSLNTAGAPVTDGSWRDPKVFDITGLPGIADGYKWGMALTDMERNTLFFLKSKNMVEWSHAGSYEVYRPECPDVVTLNDGNRDRTVITFTSRYYVVCDLSYEDGAIVMRDSAGTKIDRLVNGDPHFIKMEYGVDSYACQTFYIDPDSDSAYRGKSVALSWFSGVPNADASIESGVLQTARKVWNGGGMTIPVVYGLSGETLSTTPITVADEAFAALKTKLVDIYYSPLGDVDPLGSVNSQTAEIIAKISDPAHAAVSIKVNMSADGAHYTEIGWNRTEGYFVDRTHTEDGGIIFPQPNYAKRYASGMGTDNTVLDFYILVDKNNVEVYCDGYTVPFYILTFASPYSGLMSLTAENEITLNELKVNSIGTVWRESSSENMLYLSDTNLELGLGLTDSKDIVAACDGEIVWTVISGEGVVEVTPTDTGATVKGVAAGSAMIEAKCGGISRIVNVNVHTGSLDTEFTFTGEGVVSGDWYFTSEGLVGSQSGGDGFILAEETGSEFMYSADFDLGSGAAAALVFRATAEDGKLVSYLIANYDHYGKVVKLWSQNGELGKESVTPPSDTKNLSLAADVKGDVVRVSFNGVPVIEATLGENEPKTGHFGLNICATRATFKSVHTVLREYEYESGRLLILSGGNTRIDKVINRTTANTEIAPAFYFLNGNTLSIDDAYMSLLPAAGKYVLSITGDKLALDVTVDVKSVPTYDIRPVMINEGTDAYVFIGNRTTEYIKVNGTAVRTSAFSVKNYMLKLSSSVLPAGQNEITLSDGTSFFVSVIGRELETITIQLPPVVLDMTPVGIGVGVTCGIILLAVIAFVVLIVLARKGKVTLIRPFCDRTEAIRRRNLGLIASACIVGAVALVLLVAMLTAPIGFAGLLTAFIIVIIFGYPYSAQMFWNGKMYKQSTGALRVMGTPKEIFDIDKSGNKLQTALRYVGAAFKTLWLCIRILFSSVVAFIRSPFYMVGQTKAVMYGEFGHSNKAESCGTREPRTAEAAAE